MSAPTLPTGHEEYEALAVAWAIAALEPAEQHRFEGHRARCARCAGAVADALDVAVELAYCVPDVELPTGLKSRLLAAVAVDRPAGAVTALPTLVPDAPPRVDRPALGPPATRRTGPAVGDQRPAGSAGAAPEQPGTPGAAGPDGSGPPVAAAPVAAAPAAVAAAPVRDGDPGGGRRSRTRPGRHRAPDPRRLATVLAAAAIALLSVVTTWQVAGSRDTPTPAPAAAPADRVAALRAGVGDRTVATVVLRGDRAEVVTDVLAPNAGRDSSYVLWGVPAGGGAPAALGSFEVMTGDGLRSYPVRLVRAPAGYPVLAVSEEPAGSLPAEPASVIASGALSR